MWIAVAVTLVVYSNKCLLMTEKRIPFGTETVFMNLFSYYTSKAETLFSSYALHFVFRPLICDHIMAVWIREAQTLPDAGVDAVKQGKYFTDQQIYRMWRYSIFVRLRHCPQALLSTISFTANSVTLWRRYNLEILRRKRIYTKFSLFGRNYCIKHAILYKTMLKLWRRFRIKFF